MKTSTAPTPSFTANAPVEGLELGMSGLPPVTRTVMATIPTSVTIQPST